jgi:cholesterol oxidase
MTGGHEPEEFVEALVVGSGFGGSVAALRLGEAGVRTLVLERGRRWDVTDAQDTFATYEAPDGRAAWLSPVTVAPAQQGLPIDVYTGVLERLAFDGVEVLAGAGVGGGSLVYNAVLLQPQRALFRGALPEWLDYDEMDSVWYPLVRSVIEPGPMPADVLAAGPYLSTRLMLAQGERAGLRTRLLDLALDWDVVRAELTGARKPSVIAGEVWYGTNSGAKKSLDRNYLARAQATGLVDVEPLHVVTGILADKGYYRVSVERIDETGRLVAHKAYRTRRLFLGAGSIGTTRLLLESKARRLLPHLNDFVGTRWGTNGDAVGLRNNMPPGAPGLGGTAGALWEDHDNPVLPTTIMNMPMPQAHPTDDFMATLGMAPSPAKGRFRYDQRRHEVTLTWPGQLPATTRVAAAMRATYERVANAATDSRPDIIAVDTSVTAHPCGGVPLGIATDSFGRLSEYPGIYVLDGALLPEGNSGAANPALTIAALAERTMARVVSEVAEGGALSARQRTLL